MVCSMLMLCKLCFGCYCVHTYVYLCSGNTANVHTVIIFKQWKDLNSAHTYLHDIVDIIISARLLFNQSLSLYACNTEA